MSTLSAEFPDNDENTQPLLNGEKKTRVSNQRILQVCALLFGLFVIAEMIGAVVRFIFFVRRVRDLYFS